MTERPSDSWRARAAVSEAVEVFGSNYMQELWTKALARRETDPEGAVTTARTLLESVCKHILDEAQKPYREGLPLNQLYRLAAEVLDIAPNETIEPLFSKLFQACTEIISGVGTLRNHLSDAHGRGPFGAMPDWRHAELAVNLSGAMATYLAAVWKGRQPTVADVIRRYVAEAEAKKPLGLSQRYTLEKIAGHEIGNVVASKLQLGDLIALCEERRRAGIGPSTIMQYVVFLRVAMGERYAHLFHKAMPILRSMNLVAKSQERRRRPTHEEYDALIDFFRKQEEHRKTVIPMGELVEFAIWSGRPINEIVSLRWSDVDFERRTCKLPGSKESFPLLDRAWEIIKSRPRLNPSDKSERIFPYNSKSASARHTLSKKRLAGKLPSLRDLRFNDYRFEAVSRLLERGHQPHEVARATGQDIKNVIRVFEELQPGSPRPS